ncbi:MAG TPA: DUF748 domain-containing protein [Burkholderiaceae bacterium]|nr:DUF748 domain-containing protein [Burkholderiaceae bacterium]
MQPAESAPPSPQPVAAQPLWRRPRTWAVLIAVLALLFGAAFIAATQLLKRQVEAALGPQASVGRIGVSWQGVVLSDVVVRANRTQRPDWPAAEELRARRVRVLPQISSLFSDEVRIARVTIEGGELTVLRRATGELTLLPSLLQRKPAARAADAAGPAPAQGSNAAAAPAEHAQPSGLAVRVERIELVDCAVAFFDASVRRPALALRLDPIKARFGPLAWPSLAGKSELDVQATLKAAAAPVAAGPAEGAASNAAGPDGGAVRLQGWIELASRDMELDAALRHVDLRALSPYLLKPGEGGVKRGTLDLDLRSTVKAQQLRAPGTLTLRQLDLASGSGASGAFMGVPRSAVLAALKDDRGQIVIKFTLAGRLDDPRFSLNEDLLAKMTVGLAGTLGIKIEELARLLGGAGQSAVQAVGDAARKLLGR